MCISLENIFVSTVNLLSNLVSVKVLLDTYQEIICFMLSEKRSTHLKLKMEQSKYF